jgi:NAD-dependent SIR2 family protein deacetylase
MKSVACNACHETGPDDDLVCSHDLRLPEIVDMCPKRILNPRVSVEGPSIAP